MSLYIFPYFIIDQPVKYKKRIIVIWSFFYIKFFFAILLFVHLVVPTLFYQLVVQAKQQERSRPLANK